MHDKSIEQEKALPRTLAMQSTFHIPLPTTVLPAAEWICGPKPTLSLRTCFSPAASPLACFQGDLNQWVSSQAQQCHTQHSLLIEQMCRQMI